MREEVRKFAKEMEVVLKQNDFKGGWSQREVSLSYLEAKLITEVGEYFRYVAEREEVGQNDHEKAKKELVDIANFCLMVHSRL